MIRSLTKTRAAAYVSQNFLPIFQAPGEWDRASGRRLILRARAILTEIHSLSRRRRKLTRDLIAVAKLIESTITNEDPRRSP